ncbi:hypothetical protein GWK47_001836 [Chionoecetes opilio]|uniref:Uncharacterized protein n=1 Tax=Chionoecetes opilio TaxID=41210 RepID=A0A8J5CHZ5_CHIOP|nr:hypothetical protein GWK47_001836 [Chionoecetes opilio]
MLAMPTSSVQRHRMDLNALREQLQKLVPGAHLTLTHHHTEGSVNSGSPSLEGLPPGYPPQTAMGGIPLTVVGSSGLAHQGGLGATTEAGMILPQTVRLPGGETVALVRRVMVDPHSQAPVGYPAMVAMDHGPPPLQAGPPLSRTPSLKDPEEQGGDGHQTRITRFQVTKVAEEAVRRVSDVSTAGSPVSSPVRRGRFAVTKVAESLDSTEGGTGSAAPTPAPPDTP